MSFQWYQAILPTYRRRAHVKVELDWLDVTDILKPYLISVRVMSKDWEAGPDYADIELDDRDAQLPIPPKGTPVRISMGWEGSGPQLPLGPHVKQIYQSVMGPDLPNYIKTELPWADSGYNATFVGMVTSVESGFSRRGGGRRLWIEAKTWDSAGKVKEPTLATTGTNDYDEQKTVKEHLETVLGNIGMTLFALGGAGDIKRPFWAADHESPMHAARRYANEAGLAMTIIGNNVFLLPRLSDSYYRMATVEAIWGVNLIAWRLKPFTGRAEWKGSDSHFFDRWEGLWKKVSQTITGQAPSDGGQATMGLPNAAPNEHVGEQFNNENSEEAYDGQGTGYVLINGEPAAVARGHVLIKGARPGVDGNWLIREAEHIYSRSNGYTTRLELKRPQLNASVYADYKTEWKKILSDIEKNIPVPKQEPGDLGELYWPPGLPQPPSDV